MAPYENSLWYIETNTHPLLESATTAPKMVNYIRPSFWQRFLELNRVMWDTNAGLTERHAYDSRPQTWPVLRRGINFWTKDHRQIYLMGNPFVWWGSLCAIMVYFGARALLMLRAKRGFKDYQDTAIVFYDQTCGFLALGWAMHFLPFFAMHRQLFIHHYLPALYFSILLLAVLFDVLTAGLRPKFRFLAAIVMILIAFASYSTYAPITYATPWTSKSCERARLLKTWDLNCKDFPDSLKKYKDYGPAVHNTNWKNSSLPLAIDTAAGAVTQDALQQEAVAQAGNHPFQQAPQKVSPSSSSAEGLKNLADSHEKGAPLAGQEALKADKVQPDVAPPEPAQPVPAGTASVPEGQAILEEEEKKQELDNQQNQKHGADLQGLDQEGVEEVVLGGTASNKDRSRSSASAATTPSQIARANEATEESGVESARQV